MKAVEVFKKLESNYNNNIFAHAYLIETNNIDNCFQDLLLFIKKISCNNKYENNCNKCNICNLIDNNALPSLVIIENDGINIKKEQVLELKKRFSTLPIFTKNNIYLIKNAEKLNSSSANSILKFVEEPTDNIIGFLVTNNINNVIPTIKSRCEILTIDYDISNSDYLDFYEIAKEYLIKTETEKKEKILINKELIFGNFEEKSDIEKIFKNMLEIYINLYKKEYFPGNVEIVELKELSKDDLLFRIELVSRVLDDINTNVNLELLLDKYIIELSGGYV